MTSFNVLAKRSSDLYDKIVRDLPQVDPNNIAALAELMRDAFTPGEPVTGTVVVDDVDPEVNTPQPEPAPVLDSGITIGAMDGTDQPGPKVEA